MQRYTINNPVSSNFSNGKVVFIRNPDITKQRILFYLRNHMQKKGPGLSGWSHASDIARELTYSKSHIQYYLGVLQKEGKIDSITSSHECIYGHIQYHYWTAKAA